MVRKTLRGEQRERLYGILKEKFSKDDLEELCFLLNVDWEDLEGETKSKKAISIIEYFHNKQKISILIQYIHDQRPECYISLFDNLLPHEKTAQYDQLEEPENIAEPVENESYPIFTEARHIQIVIFQLFRMADFLTYPKGVRATRFYDAFTNRATHRRVLNTGHKVDMSPYGVLKPVVLPSEEFNPFWKKAIIGLETKSDPLGFFPFELDLTERLKTLKPQPNSIFEHALRGSSRTIQNLQLSGRLRMYPPGTGIIKLGMTLEFKKGVQIETVGKLARDAEVLLFVDPRGEKIPCETIFIDIINKVSETFYKRNMYSNLDRRWQPPEATFLFRDFNGKSLDHRTDDLARLLAYAPANNENLHDLRSRVEYAVNSIHWYRNNIFFVTGQGAAIVLGPNTTASGNRERQKVLLSSFVETRELVSAALYAEKAYAERVEEIYQEKRLDESWLPDQSENFTNLYNLLITMRRVFQAVYSIKNSIKNQGPGELMSFANDLWSFNNPVDYDLLINGLNYIADWLRNLPDVNQDEKVVELLQTIDKVQSIPQPFKDYSDRFLPGRGSNRQEKLEDKLIEGVEKYEELQNTQASDDHIDAFNEEMRKVKAKLDRK